MNYVENPNVVCRRPVKDEVVSIPRYRNHFYSAQSWVLSPICNSRAWFSNEEAEGIEHSINHMSRSLYVVFRNERINIRQVFVLNRRMLLQPDITHGVLRRR